MDRPIPKSRYCPTCRFEQGNPFKPGVVLGIAYAPPMSQHVELQADLSSLHGVPFEVELRCLMETLDPPVWKHDLRHTWPDSGISLFLQNGFRETRLCKIEAIQGDDKRSEEENVPFNMTRYCLRMPSQSHIPLIVRAKFHSKKGEAGFYVAIVSVRERRAEEIVFQIRNNQMPEADRYAKDLRRINAWVNAHRPDRSSSEISCLEPPVLCVQCPMSMMRIEVAVRGEDCEHLQPFDLASFVQTMLYSPPKTAWLCPICSRVCLPHKIVLDAFGQQVLNKTDPEVHEVLVAQDGRHEISKFVESEPDTSDPEADIQHKKKRRKTELESRRARDERDRIRTAWAKLQEGDKPYGFMADGQTCSRCEKTVGEKGGLLCGRPFNDGDVRGCGLKYCWRCMNQARGEVGKIRTTKTEFLALDNPWWMHDKCMSKDDEQAYFDEEGEGGVASLEDDDGPETFAWE